MNYNYDTKEVHISVIRIGDVIEFEGHHRTVGGNNIKSDSFMGTSIFGDNYKSGHKLVTRIDIKTK